MIRFLQQTLALILGVFFPLIETFRRSHQWSNLRYWPAILDDYAMGGLLLAGALVARRSPQRGQTLLAAAWGFACAMMYGSFFGQLAKLGDPDPSGFPAECVVAVKGVLFALCIAGLTATLISLPAVDSKPA